MNVFETLDVAADEASRISRALLDAGLQPSAPNTVALLLVAASNIRNREPPATGEEWLLVAKSVWTLLDSGLVKHTCGGSAGEA